MILAGIDEAGLGPMIGPLVCSASAWEVADATGPEDLWKRLGRCVARRPLRRQGKRVSICDSKLLYNRQLSDCMARLEGSVLTLLAQLHDRPAHATPAASLGELLDAISPGARQQAGRYAWYGPCGLNLPRSVSPVSISLTANALALGMRSAGVKLLGVQAVPVLAEDFNRLIAATDNKSSATFGVTCRLIDWLYRRFDGQDLHITVDRQGGRMHHREHLQQMFPGVGMTVVEETNRRSTYRLDGQGRCVDISFVVEGEKESLPTALASMVSKYLRELHMEMLNDYWATHVPQLKPTAGYFGDGRRFYDDIRPALERLGVNTEHILRSR